MEQIVKRREDSTPADLGKSQGIDPGSLAPARRTRGAMHGARLDPIDALRHA